MLTLLDLQKRLWKGEQDLNPNCDLAIAPFPRIEKDDLGNVGLDLHLGSWFATFRETDITNLKVGPRTEEDRVVKSTFVQLGHSIILHPGQFLLGITLEWLRLPHNLAAHVVGKSSWGRRGLIIATATGVQPGFSGCLTLEIANVGRTPLELRTAVPICQLFFEEVSMPSESRRSTFSGSRKPSVGPVKEDWLGKAIKGHPTFDPIAESAPNDD
ncbi:MAG: dCTP deaminase [Armatimonadetes bacterium]|nr:dCTP deaminase [Armatimonadota bacterium]